MTYDILRALYDMAQEKPGWIGCFTTTSAPGAIPSTSRIVKAKDEPGDATPLGTGGTVLGSMLHPEKGICYFIEWDDKPKCAVAVIAWKIAVTA